jgi:hypothetical protein
VLLFLVGRVCKKRHGGGGWRRSVPLGPFAM